MSKARPRRKATSPEGAKTGGCFSGQAADSGVRRGGPTDVHSEGSLTGEQAAEAAKAALSLPEVSFSSTGERTTGTELATTARDSELEKRPQL